MSLMRKYLTIIAILLISAPILGQKRIDYSKDKIEWINPWLTTSNSASFGLNETFLKEIGSYTEGALSGYYEGGRLQNFYSPQSSYGGNFDIESYLKLGKSYLKGAFEYGYSNCVKSKWRGWFDPYHTPFMLADSIPGNLSIESYNMEAALAIPMGRKVLLGVDFKYNVGVMAKHKDLRNKNTIMNFELYPSFMYSGDSFNFGISVGYARNTEKVEYLQVDASTEKYLFYLYGLWLYSSNGYSSAETSREENTDVYSASLTLDGTIGDIRIFNHFNSEYKEGLQTEVGYNNLTYGLTKRLKYEDKLLLFYGPKHKLSLKGAFYTMTGDRFLQRQELDPKSNIRRWVTYGGPINFYYRTCREEDVSYTYRAAKTYTDVNWELTAGFKEMAISHKYKETPLLFSQTISTRNGYINFADYFRRSNQLLKVSCGVGYSFSSGLKNDESQGQNRYQLEDLLTEEYNFLSASKWSLVASVNYIYKSLSVGCSYYGVGALDTSIKGARRDSGVISIGFIF